MLRCFRRNRDSSPEANQPFLISLTPNFSWVRVASGEVEPLQRFSTVAARTGQVEKTVETVGARAGLHPPN